MTLARLLHLPKPRLWVGAVAVGSFSSLCGLLPQLTGGYVAQTDFNSLGYFAESYYTSRSEVVALAWANAHFPPDQPLQMNTLMTERLQFATARPIINDDFPGLLVPSAILFLGTETTVTGNDATVGENLAFVYPKNFLYETRSHVYSNGGAGLYG